MRQLVPVGYADTTLRDLATPPWGAGVGSEELAAAARALASAGAAVLEAVDPRSARAALARAESPWDRLRAAAREAGSTPVGVVAGARTLWGERACAPDVVRRFVLCAAESGAGRLRVFDPLNRAQSMLPAAEAAREAGVRFVPTLVIGPAPDVEDPRWRAEALALAALPGTALLCLSDPAGHLAPTTLATLLIELGEATGLPIEVQVQAPGGLAALSAVAAVAAGAAAIQAAAGPVALAAARPSVETLRAALVGGLRYLACDRAALDAAARVVEPMLPSEQVRQAAAAAFGPAVPLPPDVAAGLARRLGRLGLLGSAGEAAEEAAAVARDAGALTLATPVADAIVAQAVRHLTEGVRWSSIEPLLAEAVLGRCGEPRGPVAQAAREVAEANAPPAEPPVDLDAVARSAPAGISEEDAVLWAEAPEATSQLLERRRSLGAEAAADPGLPTIDRELLEMLVDVVETAGDTEVIVEVSGARVTVRPAGPARAADRGDVLAPVVDPYEGLVRVESPMVGTFYRAPAPDADPFVMEGQRVKAGEVLCLIEAMKLFNEILAEQDGTVRHIHAENEEPVEFGQLLFIVEP